MLNNLLEFLAHWGIAALSLWLVSFMFRGITFSNKQALFVAALLLGFANAIVRPIFILLTFPLTLITFGFFLLVINALMLLLVAALVKTQGGQRFSPEVLTSNSGFAGIDGVFRFRQDGTNERGLAIFRVAPSGAQVVSPAPKSFGASGT